MQKFEEIIKECDKLENERQSVLERIVKFNHSVKKNH